MKKKFMFASILELLLIIVYHNIHSIRRFRMIWRLPNGSNKIARLDAKSTVVLLLDIVVSFADSARIRCRFHVGSLSFILSVLMLLFGHHRRHKLACCTCFAFCCLFHWFLFIFAQRKSCVLKGFRRLSFMFFFFLLSFWKKCDVGFFFRFDEIMWRDCGCVWSFWMHPFANGIAWCGNCCAILVREWAYSIAINDFTISFRCVFCSSWNVCCWRTS